MNKVVVMMLYVLVLLLLCWQGSALLVRHEGKSLTSFRIMMPSMQPQIALRLSTSALHMQQQRPISTSPTKLFVKWHSVLPNTGVFFAVMMAWKSKAWAVAKKSVIRGWDLYGRVPYDDWLFSTEKLLDPNLLRPSIVEAVTREIPGAAASFARRKSIYEMITLGKTVGYILLGSVFLTFMILLARIASRNARKTETNIRGFDTPVSARYKGKSYEGKQVAGNPDFYDMNPARKEEETNDDDEDDDDDEE